MADRIDLNGLKVLSGPPMDFARAYGSELPGLQFLQFPEGAGATAKFRFWDLMRTFSPQRSVDEIGDSVGAIDTWFDPNKAGFNGRYAKPLVYGLLGKAGILVDMVYTANNTSSSRSSVIGTAEELTKMHAPLKKARESKYAWIREIMGPHDNAVGLLAGLALDNYHPDQPVSCYAYDEEAELHERLGRWGLKIKNDDTVEGLTPFGEGTTPVTQYHYIGENVATIVRNIIVAENVQSEFHHFQS